MHFPNTLFRVDILDCHFLAWHSDRWFAAVNRILECSCVISNRSVLIKLNYSECLKKNPTACSQIQTAVRLHSKGPAITAPVCHMKLPERHAQPNLSSNLPLGIQSPPHSTPPRTPRILCWVQSRSDTKPIVPAGIWASNLPAASLFNISIKLTQINRTPCYSNPVFNQISSNTLYTYNIFECRMSELVLPCKYLLLY
jgi:hypothetical protein